MFTEITADVRLTKLIDERGESQSSQPFNKFTSRVIDINGAKDFAAYLDKLAYNKTIIYGLLQDPKGPRQLNNIKGIDNPWVAFDGDYIINNSKLKDKTAKLSIELLTSIDPQLRYTKYVERSSSSNLIVDGQHVAEHKRKIWMQFSTTSQEAISNYIDILFKKAIINNYGEYILSQSPNTYAAYLRTIFDKAVFSPERIWNEAPPLIQADNIQHNRFSNYKEGEMINPSKLKPLTSQEEALYIQIVQELKEDIRPYQEIRKQEIRQRNPDLYDRLQEAEDRILTTAVTLNDYSTLSTVEIVNDYLQHMHQPDEAQYHGLTLRDPLDPDYGEDKARLFYNYNHAAPSIYIHSFAHGATKYRVLVALLDMPYLSLMSKLPNKASKTKLSLAEKTGAIKTLKTLTPYIYINDATDVSFIAEELKHITAKKSIESILLNAVTKHNTRLEDSSSHMEQYSIFARKDVPFVSFDQQEGVIFISREGMKALMENKEPELTGTEITKAYLNNPDRREVTGMGMYAEDASGRLNLWAGFNAYELPYKVTEEEIAPYLELASLIATTSEQLDRFLDWRADLIQRPLRPGGRPGYAVKGSKGTGKSFEQKLIASMFHPFNVNFVDKLEQIVGKHNAEHAHTVLIIAEELNMQNSEIRGARDTMKALLTSDTWRVEPKGVDAFTVPNHVHIMLSTNHAVAVMQDSDDRRWDIYTIQEKRRRDKVYFERLQKWWDEGGKDKVFTFFKQRDYDKLSMLEGKLLPAGLEERIATLYGIDAWVYFLLTTMNGDIVMTSADLLQEYKQWHQMEYGREVNLGVKKFGAELNKQSIITKSNNMRILNKEAGRKAFENKFLDGKIYNWDDVDYTEEEPKQEAEQTTPILNKGE